jgi:hypothetical protein
MGDFKMYLVMAYRYGNLQGYHFPVGIFSDLDIAIKEAKLHRDFRGGKYDHRIYEINPEHGYDAEEAKIVSGTSEFTIT